MDGRLRLRLAGEGADAERLGKLTGFLRQELLLLDVDDVLALPAGEPPLGARGLDAATVAALLVGIGSGAQGLRAVITAVSGETAIDQDRLITLFIGRHTTRSASGERSA